MSTRHFEFLFLASVDFPTFLFLLLCLCCCHTVYLPHLDLRRPCSIIRRRPLARNAALLLATRTPSASSAPGAFFLHVRHLRSPLLEFAGVCWSCSLFFFLLFSCPLAGTALLLRLCPLVWLARQNMFCFFRRSR
ncbi:unnamed protein product [Sphacelaria rigidula]